MGCEPYSPADIGRGFACTIAAGLATVLGTIVLFFAPLQNTEFVAAALGFSGGVLAFISLVDIYIGKSVGHFTEAGNSDAQAFLYATLCLFGGMPIAAGLCKVSDWGLSKFAVAATDHVSAEAAAQQRHNMPLDKEHVDGEKQLQGMDSSRESSMNGSKLVLSPSKMQLLKVGMLAGTTIAFHNMPEGLVTFTAYLDSVKSGVTTAVAIAIHNIPEGIVVAIPIYYATGNKLLAALTSAASAITEPLGALIGLAVACTGSLNDVAFGVVFGLVGGIMLHISLQELLPEGRKHDVKNRVSALAVSAGMAVMAASLVAILYSQ